MTEKPLQTTEYVDQVSLLLDLRLGREHRPGIVENFATLVKLAKLINEFPLPDEIEAAPVFEP